eukprot:TRINITY_DN286_c0_g1_i5.p1 TRINITY_DN286_c0_g1~~TRINITY_DN286_c0_g1_i5.p1  ORF type:complete len:222 (-),score=-17.33 TRINITY_DN286_c0_g1_i5:612-1277(-)
MDLTMLTDVLVIYQFFDHYSQSIENSMDVHDKNLSEIFKDRPILNAWLVSGSSYILQVEHQLLAKVTFVKNGSSDSKIKIQTVWRFIQHPRSNVVLLPHLHSFAFIDADGKLSVLNADLTFEEKLDLGMEKPRVQLRLHQLSSEVLLMYSSLKRTCINVISNIHTKNVISNYWWFQHRSSQNYWPWKYKRDRGECRLYCRPDSASPFCASCSIYTEQTFLS